MSSPSSAVAVPSPRDEAELLARAHALSGSTLGLLAARFGVQLPQEMRRAKGVAGALLERALGASSGSQARPDFDHLGIELKTLPVDSAGRPLETTFVCTIPLLDVGDVEWADSRVRAKLSRVLWVPILSERSIALGERVIGTALLWSPSEEEEAELRWDWEELAGLIGRGNVDDITGHLGRSLQVRPKARDSHARRMGFDGEGHRVEVLPRGFYLRTSFTERVVRAHFRPLRP